MGGTQAIDINCIPQQINYTALGHLHRQQNSGTAERNIYYSGSPLSYSFAEAEQEKFVLISGYSDNACTDVKKLHLNAVKIGEEKFENIDETLYGLQKIRTNWLISRLKPILYKL